MDYSSLISALISLLRVLDGIPRPVKPITSLKETVDCLLEILEEHSQRNSLAINHLEAQIRDASSEAENIIQSHMSRQSTVPSESMISCGLGSCFWEMLSAVENMIPAIHLCERPVDVGLEFQGLEKIIDEFDSILEALSKIENEKLEDLQPAGISLTESSSGFVFNNKSSMVGVDQDLLQIKDRLTGSPSKLNIISIVGMGGIGKTTLAKNLYNDSLIEHHFDTRAWIVVSQKYHLKEVLGGLLKHSARDDGGELHHQSIEQLAECLYKSLKGRRYLIVMDDVWDTKAWDDVRRYFPNDYNGSRIILTTRLLEVATYANSGGSIHHMSLLSHEASWRLLCHKVFGEACCPFELTKIGMEIANSCKGLPLAISVIGGLLTTGNRTQDYWEDVAKNIKSDVIANDNELMEILSLSYKSLPHHLQACFLYMAVFPEDYVIFVSQLIKLWIAEGFIKSVGDKSFEEVAEDYLNDLIDRSLIMIHKRNHNGGVKTCIVHDVLRELCIIKAQKMKFLKILNADDYFFSESEKDHRVVSVQPDIIGVEVEVDKPRVRSLLLFCWGCLEDDEFLSFARSFRLLRVLDALTRMFDEFPLQILDLIYLRYLGFTYHGKRKLPASISILQKLQTLVVYRGNMISDVEPPFPPLYLPSTIWEMPQLRHLWFDRCFLPYPIHTHRGRNYVLLENLHTLSQVTDLRCSEEVLEIMPNLKKLGISYIHDTHTKWSSYEFNNFVYLHKLETLKCHFIAQNYRASRSLPINLALPHSLKRLTLSGCQIRWEKMTILGTLPNLEVLKLKTRAFSGPVWEPNEGEFSKLKFLLIDSCYLKHWRATDTHFPHLQHLSLSWCSYLAEIPSEIGEISTLEMLELYACCASAEASARLIQEEQQSYGNYNLRVRITHYNLTDFQHQYTSLRKELP